MNPAAIVRRAAMGVCFALCAAAAQAQIAPLRTDLGGAPPKSLLWVGNSFFFFNNGIHRYVTGLANAAGKENRLRNVLVTIGGSGIDWHDVDSYLKPGGKMGWYSFVGDNEIRFNKPGEQFDTVIIMDCSQCPIHPQLSGIFHEYAKKDAEIARKYGVRTSYAALTGKSPVGNTYTGGVDPQLAAFLQTVAWETVREYFASAKKAPGT